MKKIIMLLSLFSVMNFVSLAQNSNHYEYVVIPTQFKDISSGLNPYNVCSSSLQILAKKKITAIFEDHDKPSDACNGLYLNIENNSSLFRVGVIVTLSNCKQDVVYTSKGVGQSKEYEKGYEEALEDAFKNLNELPLKPETIGQTLAPTAIENKNETYVPKNMYTNDTYMVDVVDAEGGNKNLKIVNGTQLGYTKLQVIATLIPSDAANYYTVKWINAKGIQENGTAQLTNNKLTITLSSSQKIELVKP